jgi:hypothetical protein
MLRLLTAGLWDELAALSRKARRRRAAIASSTAAKLFKGE